MSHVDAQQLLLQNPNLAELVELCRNKLSAVQVWLFGSRARGDHTDNSDWDIMAIIDDDADDNLLNPLAAWDLKSEIDLKSDLLVAKNEDFISCQDAVTTLAYQVHKEGVLLYG